MTVLRAGRVAGVVAVLAVVALAGLSEFRPTGPSPAPPASADPIPNPHLSTGAATDSCATCHRTHTGSRADLLGGASQTALCFSCHDGTGSNYNVAAEYSDPTIPTNDAVTGSFFSHAVGSSSHTSAKLDEFRNVLNRHSECTDCHNPHTVNDSSGVASPGGWLASGAINGITGVGISPLVWKDPVIGEYELCLKCHSRYTQLRSYPDPSQKKLDKAAEIVLTNASYHPILGPGTNNTTAMSNSLAGGSLWQFTTGSTVRCLNCHANYSLRAANPAAGARLAPHASKYQAILLDNYRGRDLKPQGEPYATNDFSLCYLCHSEAPFNTVADDPRTDTDFRLHGKHLTEILDKGSGGLDIDVAGSGQGNALCAECHFQLHSTKLGPWPANQGYARGVNFAPNVQPLAGQTEPLWSQPDRTCALVCHGKDHETLPY